MPGADPFGDAAKSRSLDRWRAIAYPALALLALCTLALRLGWFGGQAAARSYAQLYGMTDEREAVSVQLDGARRIHALDMRLVGLCENGGRYQIGWEPDSPRIPFRAGPRGIEARETAARRSREGIASTTVVWTIAHVSRADETASGDARYRATFRYPSGRRVRCDSGYVHWSAALKGPRGGAGETEPGLFPRVDSLAAAPSPARLRFARAVDRACLATYYVHRARALRRRRLHEPPIRGAEGYVADHRYQYEAIAALGAPPEAGGLYRAWLANMSERIKLESLAVRRAARGARSGWAAALDEVQFLKLAGDSLGQEFGLRICTSNGPLRSVARSRLGALA